ncbi:acetylxylan esterase [candidate division KSB1 bacterium]|nr:acetylxylan esterase [candidate division KSB1 bacterium]
MKKSIIIFFVLIIFLLAVSFAVAQPARNMVTVVVAPDHSDWEYKTGEIVNFSISVMQYGNPVKNVKLKYEINPEKMPAVKSDSLVLKTGEMTVNGGTMKQPGFLRCWATAYVDGNEYSGYATAGFDPLNIKPTTELPKDFTEFWDNAKAEAAKIPMDAVVTLIPDRCTEKVNVYHVNLQNFKYGSRFYGILGIPKADGKYPALLHVPGAGARPYQGDVDNAEKGLITFDVGIHGVPVTMDRQIYGNMMNAAIDGYWFFNLDDRDRYYYKRVYLGCVRAIDFIFSLPEFDGENLAVTGGSQGGALSIIATGLDSRIKWLAAFYPALCDLTGYLHGRAGGWPHMFNQDNRAFNDKKDKIETSKYYDVVNFARMVKVPGYYSWGFNDNVCPPTSMYAAYNMIDAPKELYIAQDTGHWTYPEQRSKANSWLLKQLLKTIE